MTWAVDTQLLESLPFRYLGGVGKSLLPANCESRTLAESSQVATFSELQFHAASVLHDVPTKASNS